MHRLAAFLMIVVAGSGWADESLEVHMVEHFARAVQVQTAVIHGQLETAREGAEWLADHPVAKEFPENAVDEMRAAARAVQEAQNVREAALGLGQMGAACGHCHGLMSARTGLDSSITMTLGESLPERMARHLWAADRMWEGLIAPSDGAWVAGAEALLEAPLTGQQVTGEANEVVDEIGQQVRDLAMRARVVFDRQQRAELYGEILSRCSGCHLGFRPD